jgi:hypothetical protein
MGDSMPKLEESSVVVVTGEQVHTVVEDDVVILGLTSEKYFSLKGVGTRIWNLLQQPVTVETLHQTIVAEYDVDPGLAKEDLLALLRHLDSEGLLETKGS